jgi:hypothetical protein
VATLANGTPVGRPLMPKRKDGERSVFSIAAGNVRSDSSDLMELMVEA